MTYLVLDLETGSKEVHKRKGNPWYNPIIAAGLKNAMICKGIIASDINLIMGLVPNSVRVIVGHNLKFDLLHLWKSERLQYIFDERQFKIWDTQLAEYILTGQQHKYAALRDIAVNKYGCKEREKLMEKYWEQGKDTSEIPQELVLEDVLNDVRDTEQVYLQQIVKAKELGMYNLIQLQMDALLATTEMEYNGFYINQQLLRQNRDRIATELRQAQEELQQLVAPYVGGGIV